MGATHRFTFAGMEVVSEVKPIDGIPLFFVDLTPRLVGDGAQELIDAHSVTVGWSSDYSKFGVWVNGVLVHPASLSESDDTGAVPT